LLFRNIMLPFDLVRADEYEKALSIACDLSRQYDAPITIVSVPAQGTAPDGEGDATETDALDRFASEQMMRHGVPIGAKAMAGDKPNSSFAEMLEKQIWEVGADLVLLAPPLSSDGNASASEAVQRLIAKSSASVFVIR
jgi:hypothetical protein